MDNKQIKIQSKIKLVFGSIFLLAIFFMSYNVSLAGCCVKPAEKDKNSCTTIADGAACPGGNSIKGNCAEVAVNCIGQAAPKTVAKPTDCNYSNSQRACFCSSDNITTGGTAASNSISFHSSTKVGCFQYKTQCEPKCKEAGYKSYVLFDISYPQDNPANALNNVAATATTSTPPPPPTSDSTSVPEEVTSGGIVPCGKSGQSMCTLCDLIKGFNIIIQYIMKIAIGFALLAIAIGGVMYVISAGDSGAVETAKTTIKNAVIGFIVIFAGWLIINTTITYLGVNETLGMKTTTTWGQFDCTANPNR